MSEGTVIQHVETKVRPVFGGKRIEVVYEMKHVKHGRTNRYLVTCELRGLYECDPHLEPTSAEWLGDMETDSNDQTLTEKAACDLFSETCPSH